MTAPGPSGGPSPLRVGGLALIGIGVVAGIIGLGTLASSGSSGNGAAAPPASTTSADTATAPPPVATTAPTSQPVVPVPSFGPTTTNAIAAPPPSPAPPAPPAKASGGDGAVTKSPVRVYNNGTIVGLAARAADDFRAAGWPVETVSSYPYGIIPTSTVYYRPGTEEQASAAALGGQFGMRVEPRFEGLAGATPGLIVIVTNDFKGR